MLTLEDFQSYVQALRYHDWNYEFSDDHSVWKAGRANARLLKSRANEDSLLMRAYQLWQYPNAPQNLAGLALRDAQLNLIRQTVAEEQPA